jgi:phosphatidylserine/phosphatidylglycerophosphate/cardiolipin synthase-like enzyme
VAWVSGHNVGDEYLGLDPDFGPWRDTHVRLKGPVASATVGTPNFEVTALTADRKFGSQMEAIFLDDFAHASIISHDQLDEKPCCWHLAVNMSRLAAPVLQL